MPELEGQVRLIEKPEPSRIIVGVPPLELARLGRRGGPADPGSRAAGAYLGIVALAFPALTRRLPRSATAVSSLGIRYLDGRGVLRRLLQVATAQGFTIDEVCADSAARLGATGPQIRHGTPLVEVTLHVHGKQPVNELAAVLSGIDDVDAVRVNDANAVSD